MKKQQITTCQPDKAVRHGGDIYRNPVRYDFSINLNPLGMPEGVKRRLKETVEDWGRYPDPQCEALTRPSFSGTSGSITISCAVRVCSACS